MAQAEAEFHHLALPICERFQSAQDGVAGIAVGSDLIWPRARVFLSPNVSVSAQWRLNHGTHAHVLFSVPLNRQVSPPVIEQKEYPLDSLPYYPLTFFTA